MDKEDNPKSLILNYDKNVDFVQTFEHVGSFFVLFYVAFMHLR